MTKKGDDFENATKDFANRLFSELGYVVLQVRKQKSGTQNGFDIFVEFLDDSEILNIFCFECKDYSKEVEWQKLLDKILQVDASSYDPTAFIGISPKADISNVNHQTWDNLQKKVKFPIRLWSPESDVMIFFALYEDIYSQIYGNHAKTTIDRGRYLKKIKSIIDFLINEKIMLNCVKKITIKDSDKKPKEEGKFTTNLDKKLDAVLEPNDPDRIMYHKFRCDYKIYLEELDDVDNTLRNRIIEWQNNLRIKAHRLTKKYNDLGGDPKEFFYEFFDIANTSMGAFLANNEYKCNADEKLLQGVIFELAAECPLNWVPKNGSSNN